jgi:uncharacterized protein (TIGR00369 family)
MPRFKPPDPDFESRVRASFNAQQVMQTIGARLVRILPGEVCIELSFGQALTQQHGFLHAGIVATLVDSACGYAAHSLMPAASEVLTVEYKINFLSPARGESLLGIGRVLKPGRMLSVCAGEAWARSAGKKKRVATMQATMICIPV